MRKLANPTIFSCAFLGVGGSGTWFFRETLKLLDIKEVAG